MCTQFQGIGLRFYERNAFEDDLRILQQDLKLLQQQLFASRGRCHPSSSTAVDKKEGPITNKEERNCKQQKVKIPKRSRLGQVLEEKEVLKQRAIAAPLEVVISETRIIVIPSIEELEAISLPSFRLVTVNESTRSDPRLICMPRESKINRILSLSLSFEYSKYCHAFVSLFG